MRGITEQAQRIVARPRPPSKTAGSGGGSTYVPLAPIGWVGDPLTDLGGDMANWHTIYRDEAASLVPEGPAISFGVGTGGDDIGFNLYTDISPGHTYDRLGFSLAPDAAAAIFGRVDVVGLAPSFTVSAFDFGNYDASLDVRNAAGSAIAFFEMSESSGQQYARLDLATSYAGVPELELLVVTYSGNQMNYLLLLDRTDPPAPDAGHVRVYVRLNGSSKQELCARFHTGAVQIIATEP